MSRLFKGQTAHSSTYQRKEVSGYDGAGVIQSPLTPTNGGVLEESKLEFGLEVVVLVLRSNGGEK